MLTHYSVLDVSDTATPEEIKKAYRVKARASHPDSSDAGNASLFALVNTAYETLRDPSKRAAYDRTLHGPQTTQAPVDEPQSPSPAPERVKAKVVYEKLSWRDRAHNAVYYATTWWGLLSVMAATWALLILVFVVFGAADWTAVLAVAGPTLIVSFAGVFHGSAFPSLLYSVAVTILLLYLGVRSPASIPGLVLVAGVIVTNLLASDRLRRLALY